MKQDADTQTADLIAAIGKGGSYIVGADGVPVRDDAGSTQHKEHTVADAAPGASAESKAADGGVPPAPAEASAKAAKR